MRHLRPLAFATLTVMAGCAVVPGPVRSGGACLTLTAAVQDARYQVQGYVTDNVSHLQVKVFELHDGSEVVVTDGSGVPVMLDLPRASLSVPVTLTNLKAQTTYRIRAFAYSDPATASLISTTDYRSYVDVVVAQDTRPTFARLPVQLLGGDFNGQATSSGLVVQPGGLSHVGDPAFDHAAIVYRGHTVSTVAGKFMRSGTADGLGSAARFVAPSGLAADGSGSLYVADGGSNTIRKLDLASGLVTTLAGQAEVKGYADGVGTAALFRYPTDLVVDAHGNVFVADCDNQRIRKITPDGTVSTFAGGEGYGSVDGTGTSARLCSPAGLAIDGSGNIYFTELNSFTVRKVTPDAVVTTLAGTSYGTGKMVNGQLIFGMAGDADGIGSAATFEGLAGITLDDAGNLYVANNNAIRKIVLATREVTTLAGKVGLADAIDGVGTDARFFQPWGLTYDHAGNLYLAETLGCEIRRLNLATLEVTTVAGRKQFIADVDGVGLKARFSLPQGITAVASGTLYVSDSQGHTIRQIVP